MWSSVASPRSRREKFSPPSPRSGNSSYQSSSPMKRYTPYVCALAMACASPSRVLAAADLLYPGADEQTPSRAHYFPWINNAWEGSTEAQTLINLDFFQWLHDEYGMQLD